MKYIKGKPFIPKAENFNRYEAAADRVLGQGTKSGPIIFAIHQGLKVWCKNSTDAVINQGDVVAIGGTAWGPIVGSTDAEIQAGIKNLGVTAAAPADNDFGNWGVAVNSIPSGSLGELFVGGIFYAKVKVGDVNGEYCEMESGSSVLVTRPTPFNSSAQILEGIAGGDGDWCLIRYIGFRPYTEFAVNVSVTAGTASNTGDSTTQCGFTYDVYCKDFAGTVTISDTALTPENARPSIGKLAAATVGTAYFTSTGTLALASAIEVPVPVLCADVTT